MNNRLSLVFLLLCILLIGSFACSPTGSDEKADLPLAEVSRGDLMITVEGTGNIEISRELKSSFGSGGKVEKIHVKEGDKVSKGDVLAKLDTDSLELALTQAKISLSRQQLAVTQAEVALTEQNLALIKAELALTEQEVTITRAGVTLETAEYNLYEAQDTYVWRDIRKSQSDVDEAQRYLDDALWNLNHASGPGIEFHQKIVIHAQSRLDTAEDILDAMLAGTDPQEVTIKKLEVEHAQQSLELAQLSREQSQQSVILAQQSLEHSQQSLELAQQSLVQTKQSLELSQKS